MLVPFTSQQTFANPSTAAALKNNGFCHPIILGPSIFLIRLDFPFPKDKKEIFYCDILY
jgi:hypothetical protein